MATREDDLSELATNIRRAIAKAQQLKPPGSVHILSMVLVEVSEALKAVADNRHDDGRSSV